MVAGRPCWRGGLRTSTVRCGEDHEIVADFECKHYAVAQNLILSPTTRQYDKYFKAAIEQRIFTIETGSNEGSAVVHRRAGKKAKSE